MPTTISTNSPPITIPTMRPAKAPGGKPPGSGWTAGNGVAGMVPFTWEDGADAARVGAGGGGGGGNDIGLQWEGGSREGKERLEEHAPHGLIVFVVYLFLFAWCLVSTVGATGGWSRSSWCVVNGTVSHLIIEYTRGVIEQALAW